LRNLDGIYIDSDAKK